ncbi:MAG: SGNH/GDSL hydrolase family protein [Lachnospiraceae bacterium]|nr:SGNH/GDSL hydrolase family protein [Lachnospiraceae bacterium]
MTKKHIKRRISVMFAVLLLITQLLPGSPAVLRVQAAPESATFDPAFYAETYPDVKAAFGNDAAKLWLHYRMFGEKEGRRAAQDVVPGVTKISAPAGVAELPIPGGATTTASTATAATANTTPANPAAAQITLPFDPAFYAETYPDVKAAFGNDAAKLWLHFRMYGEKEGRRAAAGFIPGITKATAPAGVAELPVPGSAQKTTTAPAVKSNGKRVAFIGDSITTFKGHITPTYADCYPLGDLDRVEETWWYLVSAGAGLQIVENASWSGSCVSGDRNDTSGAVASSPARVRTVVAKMPDVVFIMMGVNDFFWNTKLDFFRECYTALVRQLRESLPNARIICCTCLPEYSVGTNEIGRTLDDYNSVIRQVAGENGCYMIDTRTCGLTKALTVDDVHPNAAGAVVVAQYILSKMPALN